MSTRTVIEVNHDYLSKLGAEQWAELMRALASSTVTGQLNRNSGEPIGWTTGIRILGQRHHSETLNLKVE